MRTRHWLTTQQHYYRSPFGNWMENGKCYFELCIIQYIKCIIPKGDIELVRYKQFFTDWSFNKTCYTTIK